MHSTVLHNVTIYVEKSRFAATRDFYSALYGEHPIWEEPGHIACVGTRELAICIHEEEPGHAAGSRELFFWADDLARLEADITRSGAVVERVTTRSGEPELHCVDPEGNDIRVHTRRSSPRDAEVPANG